MDMKLDLSYYGKYMDWKTFENRVLGWYFDPRMAERWRRLLPTPLYAYTVPTLWQLHYASFKMSTVARPAIFALLTVYYHHCIVIRINWSPSESTSTPNPAQTSA